MKNLVGGVTSKLLSHNACNQINNMYWAYESSNLNQSISDSSGCKRGVFRWHNPIQACNILYMLSTCKINIDECIKYPLKHAFSSGKTKLKPYHRTVKICEPLSFLKQCCNDHYWQKHFPQLPLALKIYHWDQKVWAKEHFQHHQPFPIERQQHLLSHIPGTGVNSVPPDSYQKSLRIWELNCAQTDIIAVRTKCIILRI